jgi:hypothetical protein
MAPLWPLVIDLDGTPLKTNARRAAVKAFLANPPLEGR